MGTKTPRVFLSYSWDNKVYTEWVAALGERLRSDGIDVCLDQWQLIPGDQLPQFMETAIRNNDYVLILCTPNYKRKSDNRKGGVGYEGDVMTGECLLDRIVANSFRFWPRANGRHRPPRGFWARTM
jgi:hypothetical protein